MNTLAQLVDSNNPTALSLGLAENVADYYAQPLEITLVPTGSLGEQLPALDTAKPLALAITAVAAVLVFGLKWPMLRVLTVCAALGATAAALGLPVA